ncbi:MAG: Unknown protein [uncultured Sulfurovum sp.]|uniref:Uncharacterized protein n=1 Tax=uncultured Sulfurovum sp. TaxID=269237 RepID=A0A6S6SYM2_9BACT|nr:MAG: Unknown protein [uncultured Sulfurovum sp.]
MMLIFQATNRTSFLLKYDLLRNYCSLYRSKSSFIQYLAKIPKNITLW